MRCTSCDYPLWNLTARQCPECGAPFTPSAFEFVVSSVRFCCPHCDQDYYGTGAKGHLVPREFDCVRCGRHIHMDQMVLRPAAGLEEEDTRTDFNPWLERKRNGRFKSWIKTIGWALIAPGRLMRATPRGASTGQAWWFAVVTSLGIMSVGLIFVLPIMLLVGLNAPRSGGPGVLQMLMFTGMGSVIAVLATVVASFIGIGLWGAIAHGLLMMTGRLEDGIGRTYQAMCYSSGANVASVLLVFCGGQYVGWVWWVVSAIIMLKEAHRVHGGRSSLAVLVLPAVLLISIIGFYTYLFAVLLPGQMQGSTIVSAQSSSTFDTGMMTQGVRAYANDHNGAGPHHALELVARGEAKTPNFVTISGGAPTREPLFPGAGISFSDYQFAPTGQQAAMVRNAIDALPEKLVAHRVGDFVFTHHGADLNAADPGLWLVILAPIKPDALTGLKATEFTVGRADGATSTIPVEVFYATGLAGQNRLRTASGMPPLPDPLTVTQALPAVVDAEPAGD